MEVRQQAARGGAHVRRDFRAHAVGGMETSRRAPSVPVKSSAKSLASSAGRYHTPVEAAVAGVELPALAGHRVTEKLLARRQAEGQAPAEAFARRGAGGAFGDHAAPRDIAGVAGAGLGRELRADGGAHAVATDEKVALGAFAVGEFGDRGIRQRLDANEGAALAVHAFGQAAAQAPVEHVPRGRELRHGMGADDGAVAVEGDAAFDGHADAFRADAAGVESGEQFRVGEDAGAAARQFFPRAFIDLDAPADAPQQQRGGEPGHRAADNERARRGRSAQQPGAPGSRRRNMPTPFIASTGASSWLRMA